MAHTGSANKSQGPEERVLVKGFCVALLWATLAFLNTGSRALGNKKLRDAVVGKAKSEQDWGKLRPPNAGFLMFECVS